MATFYDKLNDVKNQITTNTGLSNIVEGSIAYQIAQAIAYEAYKQEVSIENDLINNSILNSTGSYLDNIGNNTFGVERKKAITPYITSSMKTLKFYVSGNRNFGAINNNKDIILSKGTAIYGVSGGSNIRFVLDDNYTLSAASYEGYVSATMSQGSSNSIGANTLTNHTFINYSDYSNNTLLVTNTMAIITGREAEIDEDYRYRIKDALRSVNQSSVDGVLSVVRSIPGVSDAKVYPSKDGAGTFTVYVQGITPITSDEVITDVELTLLQECVTPWANYNIVKPDYIGFSIEVNLILVSNNSITDTAQFTSLIRSNIETYINNFTDSRFYIIDLKRKILDMNSNIADVEISTFNVFRGTDEFRESDSIDVSTVTYIEPLDLEKIVVEPINDAITVVING